MEFFLELGSLKAELVSLALWASLCLGFITILVWRTSEGKEYFLKEEEEIKIEDAARRSGMKLEAYKAALKEKSDE